MFEQLACAATDETNRIIVDDAEFDVPAGIPLASALLLLGEYPLRTSPVHERDGLTQRAPYCMMGVCFDCLVEIDGAPNQQSCLATVREGMVIRRQTGATDVMRAAALAQETGNV
ncbi:MAG: (2Fe-2S)-binding protein [Roseovarius sp.]